MELISLEWRILLRSASAIVFLVACCFVSDATAHTVFKKFVQTRYKNLTVKCEACHVKGKPKTERNDFGKMFYEQFKEENLTARWQAIEDREEKKTFETEVMTPLFEKALEVVKEKENDEGQKYGDLLKDGKIENASLKKGGATEEDDDDGGDGGGDGKNLISEVMDRPRSDRRLV